MDAAQRVADAKSMYRRVLAQWAQDVLILRANGLDRPGWPRSSPIGPAVPPSARAGTGVVVARVHGRAA